MSTVRGIYRNGKIEIITPVDWPDGCEVLAEPASPEDSLGIGEEDWSDSPEAIEAWLKWYDSLEPLNFTAEERAAWEVARQAQKEFEKGEFFNQAEKLKGMWK
ncbi:MAG TPA: hypothetical protein VGZ47_05110 [Gemmataceae bacterium]|jgi:hypothetical protein|nr:hypothetical protein [Gemmataceae bacterium]